MSLVAKYVFTNINVRLFTIAVELMKNWHKPLLVTDHFDITTSLLKYHSILQLVKNKYLFLQSRSTDLAKMHIYDSTKPNVFKTWTVFELPALMQQLIGLGVASIFVIRYFFAVFFIFIFVVVIAFGIRRTFRALLLKIKDIFQSLNN
jgi:hypothetical protein